MKEYVRPEFYLTEFMPNEYIAACEWVQGTDLTINCGGNSIKVEIKSVSNPNQEYTAQPFINEVETNAGAQGMLYKNNNTSSTVQYASTIPISAGHSQSHVNGEFIAKTQSVGAAIGEQWNGYTVCDCSLPGGGASAAHHHLSSVVNHNHS